MISYIKYFFFLVYNWNPWIAWHIIKQEIKGEKKYGIHTTGADELKNLEKLDIDISHATIYMPVSYELLEEVFQHLDIKEKILFLDIGCGKGRALCMAAHAGFKQVTGIDFSRSLCKIAEENLAGTKDKIPELLYKIINNDAFYYDIPDDTDCIFFFNPFDEIIMSAVVNNINKSLKNNPRKINIIYINPLQKDLFINSGFREIWYSKKMKYIEATIFEN